jgi:beta-1,4-mannooligosaccharide/beta-1,4-mannosyl-N-acetylglucosamine phosphorylase
MGAALLDLDEPWRLAANGAPFLLSPEEPYECVGFVPNVVFPCAALCDADTGRLAVYYGAADTYVAVAFSTVQDIVEFIRANPG